jgi:chromosome segregation ATPase
MIKTKLKEKEILVNILDILKVEDISDTIDPDEKNNLINEIYNQFASDGDRKGILGLTNKAFSLASSAALSVGLVDDELRFYSVKVGEKETSKYMAWRGHSRIGIDKNAVILMEYGLDENSEVKIKSFTRFPGINAIITISEKKAIEKMNSIKEDINRIKEEEYNIIIEKITNLLRIKIPNLTNQLLTHNIINLQFEVNRKEAEFAQAEAKINKLEESKQNLQTEIQNLEESLRKLQENIEENKRSIRKLEREKNGLEEDLAETEKDLTIAQQEKQQLAQELSTLQKQLSPTNLPSFILNNKYEDLKQQITASSYDDEEIQELKKKSEKIEEEIANLKQEILDKDSEIEQLTKQIQELSQQNKKVNHLEEKLQALSKEREEKQQQLKFQEKELINHKNLIAEIRAENESLKESVQNYQFLQDKLSNAEQELQDKAAKLELFLNNKLQIVKDSLNSKDKESKKSINNFISSDLKLARIQEENTKLAKTITAKENQLANLPPNSEEYRQLLAELVQLKSQLKTKEEEIKHLEQKIKKLKEKLQRNYQNLHSKIETKKDNFTELKDDFSHQIANVKPNLKSYYAKKLDELLILQKKALKYNDDELEKEYQQRKAKLIKSFRSLPSELINDLQNLCQLQKELTQLELQLENTKKFIKVYNIQGIYAKGDVNVEGGFAVEGKIEVGVNKP